MPFVGAPFHTTECEASFVSDDDSHQPALPLHLRPKTPLGKYTKVTMNKLLSILFLALAIAQSSAFMGTPVFGSRTVCVSFREIDDF
jgi:hypothetical protein